MAFGRGLFALVTVVVATAALTPAAFGHARISRAGNTITLTSDGQGDKISPVTDGDYVAYIGRDGTTLAHGPGCERVANVDHGRSNPYVRCGHDAKDVYNVLTLRVNLGGGDDVFQGADGDDRKPKIIADGGEGNDRIYGSEVADDLSGGPGNDALYGRDDVDALHGGPGNDLLVGGDGADGLDGGDGIDTYYGDEPGRSDGGAADVITAADFGPGPETIHCGEGYDAVVVDADDRPDGTCESLAGGQTTPRPDVVGTLPLRVTIGALAPLPDAGLLGIRHGKPIHIPVTFSAAATLGTELRVSAADARRLHLPSRVIANSLGTPLNLIPGTLNSQMRLLWNVRDQLAGVRSLDVTLEIHATDVNGATTVAHRNFVLR